MNENLANESISLDVWNVQQRTMDSKHSKQVGPTDSRSSSKDLTKGDLAMTTQQHLETVPTKIDDLSLVNSPRPADLNQHSLVVIAS